MPQPQMVLGMSGKYLVAPSTQVSPDESQGSDSTARVKVGTASSSRARKKQRSRERVFHAIHVVHRLAILVGAIWVVTMCVRAVSASVVILSGNGRSPEQVSGSAPSAMIVRSFGTGTIRESPLVVSVLQNQTTPRNDTVYLTENGASFEMCANAPPEQAVIYGNTFMRYIFAQIVQDTSHNLTFLQESEFEMVAPVVDCTTTYFRFNIISEVRLQYLLRSVKNPDDVYFAAVTLSSQTYEMPNQNQEGPAYAGILVMLNDLQNSRVDYHYLVSIGYPYRQLSFRVCEYLGTTSDSKWALRTIPSKHRKEIPKKLFVSQQYGRYMGKVSQQSFISHSVYNLPSDPITALTDTSFVHQSVMRDVWSWVHFVHLILVILLSSSMVVLLIAAVQSLRQQRIWLGDAFIAISESSVYLSGVIILSWYMDNFWSLEEFSLHDGHTYFPPLQMQVQIYDEIMHADLLVIYISVSALAGKLLRVRVDPVVVLTAFEVGFKNRIQILQKVFPAKASNVGLLTLIKFLTSNSFSPGRENSITALASWSSQETTKLNLKVIFDILLPIFSTLIFVAAYILLSKAYRYFVPEALHVIRSNQTSSTNKSGKSGREEQLKQLREHFTIFELATGAELEHRFGMLSNYENCVFIHGVKHATADGIYSNGFVIANNKFLVQTQDVWSIVLMKILRYRFKNIFVFELEGTTVKKTARLVYPQTVAWADLINLNVNPLS